VFSQRPTQGFQHPGNPGTNPYGAVGQAPPPRRWSPWLWILLLLGGGSVALCLGCGGCFYLGFTGNMRVMQDDLQAKLSADPLAQQHLGTIENVEADFWASAEASRGAGREKRIIFHVRGSKGNADVVGYLQAAAGRETVHECRLILPAGEEVDLSF
jgi:hypothetical protein